MADTPFNIDGTNQITDKVTSWYREGNISSSM